MEPYPDPDDDGFPIIGVILLLALIIFIQIKTGGF